jgi:O-antigen/teichoic acid export membrane protein
MRDRGSRGSQWGCRWPYSAGLFRVGTHRGGSVAGHKRLGCRFGLRSPAQRADSSLTVSGSTISERAGAPDADLKQRTVTGLLWSAGANVGQQFLTFTVTAVLARLLVPADFGLVATVAVFTGFVSLFIDFGLGAALVQRTTLTERHRSSAFWMNVAAGLALAMLVAALAPALARFFNEPRLIDLTLVLSLNFVVASLAIVQSALLQRSMNFRRGGLIEITAILIGGALAIAMAVAGYGVWSLIAQLLATSAVRTTLLWATSDWRPHRIVDRDAMRELWRFSANLAGFTAVNYWSRSADNFLIGKFVGAAGLGIYSRAYNLMLLPITQISTVTARVMFPALSRIQQDPPRVKRAYLRAIGIIGLLSFPITAGLFVAARPFILTLYGAKWAGVVPILQILCVAGLMQPVAVTVGWIYQSQGRTDWLMRWGLATSALIVSAFGIGINWGAEGVAAAYAIITYALLYFAFAIPGKLIGMHVREVFLSLRGPLISALAMAAIVWTAGRMFLAGWPPAAVLFTQFGIGVFTYTVLIHAFALEPYRELKDLVRERVKGRPTG